MPSKSAASKAQMSASEDEIGASDQEIAKPAPPKINRTVVKKTTAKKPAATTKKATSKTTRAQREASKESDKEDDDQASMEAKPKQRKTKTTKKDASAAAAAHDEPAPPKKSQKSTKAKASDELPAQEKPARKTKAKRAPSVEAAPVIAETQQEAEEVEQSIEEEEQPPADAMDIDRPSSPPPVPKTYQRARSISQQRQAAPGAVYPRARSTSQQPRAYSRGRSVSDTERRIGESDAKRKLADMSRKYDELRIKYDSLVEIGQNAAEANFERLKKASDQKAKDANDLIASLKKELSELRKSSSTSVAESARLQSQVATLTTENEKLKEDQKATQTTLTEAQNEVKALTAKLEAARKTAAVTEKVPGSAIKKTDLSKSQIGANPEAVKEAAVKEELYRDLTGLIINSVKRRDGEDEYSCIQTGRNGTLHFHLTVATDSTITNPKTPSGLSYEETEFAYEPLLDEGRDRDLIDILPDYLTEEICFPRNHAVKFYTKVVESMTKKVVVDED